MRKPPSYQGPRLNTACNTAIQLLKRCLSFSLHNYSLSRAYANVGSLIRTGRNRSSRAQNVAINEQAAKSVANPISSTREARVPESFPPKPIQQKTRAVERMWKRVGVKAVAAQSSEQHEPFARKPSIRMDISKNSSIYGTIVL